MPLLIFNVVKSELSKCPLTHSHTQHVSEASKETEKLERTKMIGLNQISATFYFFYKGFFKMVLFHWTLEVILTEKVHYIKREQR